MTKYQPKESIQSIFPSTSMLYWNMTSLLCSFWLIWMKECIYIMSMGINEFMEFCWIHASLFFCRRDKHSTITSLNIKHMGGQLQARNHLSFLRCSNAGHTHKASQAHWRCTTFPRYVACSSLIVATTISSDSLCKTHGSMSSCVSTCQDHLDET